jgi:hypothetical protein
MSEASILTQKWSPPLESLILDLFQYWKVRVWVRSRRV